MARLQQHSAEGREKQVAAEREVWGESQQLTKIGFDFLCRGVMLTNMIKEENKCVRFL